MPPNSGLLLLRFPVDDTDDIHQLSIDKNIEVIFPPMKVGLDPYGEIDLRAVKVPGVVCLEFYDSFNSLISRKKYITMLVILFPQQHIFLAKVKY
mgnify:CR=1 FL=1